MNRSSMKKQKTARTETAGQRRRVLYAAATEPHLRRFHTPYINALKEEYEVLTMATGEGVDLPVEIQRKVMSLRNLGAVVAIRKILKREKFDAVILNTTLAAFLIRLAMVGMRNRPRVFNFVHGYLFHQPLRGKKEKLFCACERLVRGITDEIAVMNKMDLDMAKVFKLCRGRVHMTRGMGYRFPEVLPERDEQLRCDVMGDEKNAFLMTFVGLLGGDKNQEFLINATKQLREQGIPAHLMLVGDGVNRASLEQQAVELGLEKAVHFMGNCEPAWQYLAITDLYVSASKKEGLPFNIMEAMACGLPIVATNSKGQGDLLLEAGKKPIPMGDSTAFCEEIASVYRAGEWGMRTVNYPTLFQYSFDEVFQENLNMMKGFLSK